MTQLVKYSIIYVVPFSLVAFIASSCSSISCYILKHMKIFRVAIVKIVLSMCYCKESTCSLSCYFSIFASLASFGAPFNVSQHFCMALQCLDLNRNSPYWIIFILSSDIISFGLYFKVYVRCFFVWEVVYISLQHANTTFQFDNI